MIIKLLNSASCYKIGPVLEGLPDLIAAWKQDRGKSHSYPSMMFSGGCFSSLEVARITSAPSVLEQRSTFLISKCLTWKFDKNTGIKKQTLDSQQKRKQGCCLAYSLTTKLFKMWEGLAHVCSANSCLLPGMIYKIWPPLILHKMSLTTFNWHHYSASKIKTLSYYIEIVNNLWWHK